MDPVLEFVLEALSFGSSQIVTMLTW